MVSRYENMEELIGKFLAGEASAEEAMMLEDWKSASVANQEIYNRCVAVFKASGGVDLKHKVNVAKAWQRVRGATVAAANVRRLNGGLWFRVAALLLLLLGAGLLLKLVLDKRDGGETVIASGGSETAVTLKDHTMVRVFANSSVVVEEGFGKLNRRLKLKGSAYFEVVHKEAKPFVIDAGNVYIQDIGTKFSVVSSINDDTVFVKVDEGVVLLFDSVGAQIEIKATEKAMYIKSSKQIVTPKGSQVSAGKVSFTNASLGEVVTRLCESYKVSIRLENNNLANCTLTTRFENEDIETVLTVICETLSLSFEKQGNDYIIKGELCK